MDVGQGEEWIVDQPDFSESRLLGRLLLGLCHIRFVHMERTRRDCPGGLVESGALYRRGNKQSPGNAGFPGETVVNSNEIAAGSGFGGAVA